ncbi:hypothetical protein [Acetoanaerobium noterae]|uniref:hypothetical protein n=1 Tax=Acetoanaerobium noterae TaxID=745369 RepID=UPI003330A897
MNNLIKRTIILFLVFIVLSSIFYFAYAKHKIRSEVALHAVHSFLKKTDDFQYIEDSWSGRDKVWGDRYTAGVKFVDEKSTVYDFKYFWEYQSIVGPPDIIVNGESPKDDMIPKHFKNFKEAQAKSYETDDNKDDILYKYTFDDYYKEVKFKGLVLEIFNLN